MMTKEEHIKHWITSSEDDRLSMHSLFNGGRYTHALFFGHLHLEKILKALWIKNDIENTPPFTHNLLKLSESVHIGLSDEDNRFLDKLNNYQLSGIYPDYTFSLQKQTNKELALTFLNSIIGIIV